MMDGHFLFLVAAIFGGLVAVAVAVIGGLLMARFWESVGHSEALGQLPVDPMAWQLVNARSPH